jgi:SAM-dependent methyltransferase
LALASFVSNLTHRIPDWYGWLLDCGVKRSSKILDVGCGSGELLWSMHEQGFSNLTGIDMFFTSDKKAEGIQIKRGEVSSLAGQQYDLIMLHHALEHMPDQVRALSEVAALLNPNGFVLIRVPIKSQAWDVYGESWVQLDAPRHFYLHTEKSLEWAAAEAGLGLVKKQYDSTGFQFWGSEQYLLDIPLADPRSVQNGGDNFGAGKLAQFERQARVLNKEGKGDQAAFLLKKLPPAPCKGK